MGVLDKIFGTDDDTNNANNNTNSKDVKEGTLQLRKEELDINKNKVQTGEVILSKEVVEEPQTVNVPVTHEEVVIERRTLNNQPTDSQIGSTSDTSDSTVDDIGLYDQGWGHSVKEGSTNNSDNSLSAETIRIPLTEEQVDVDKKTVVAEEITAYKRGVEENKKIEETVRREEAHVDTTGNAVIADGNDYTNTSASNGSTTAGANTNTNTNVSTDADTDIDTDSNSDDFQ